MSYLVYVKQALANLFKPPVTSKYPLEPKKFCAGDRGRVINDVSQCILCGMCERSCPAGALTVDRKTGTWKINPFSCIQCGACVEACPKKCLSMDPHYAMPALEKSEIVLQAIQKEGKAEVRKEVQTAASTLSMDDRSHIVNNVMKCIFCGMCERNCPAGAITVDRRNRTWRINLEACVNCGTCIDNCPRKCLSLGCYLGNRTDITIKGKMPMRRAPAKPAAPTTPVAPKAVAAEPAPAKVVLDIPDTHIFNEIEKCLFCGKCEHNCPGGAISLDRKNRTWTIDREKCITCGVCVDDCPVHCLTLRDTWEEGEKKELHTTYQGKVLTRRPRVRPAPPKAVEPPKAEPVKPAAPVETPAKVADQTISNVPESTNPWHVRNDIDQCLFCGKCEHTCPVDAISIDRKNRTWTIDRDKCVTCGQCVEGCPKKCLTLEEEWQEGENKAVQLTIQGKAPTRPTRPAPKKVEPPTPVAPPTVKEEPVAESNNPWHVKNDIDNCLFCGKCEHTCPVDAISIDRKNRTWSIDRDKCVTCGQCVEGCPKKCLTLEEEWQEGENKAVQLTLQGKAPVRPSRPAPKAAPKAEPKAEVKVEPPKESIAVAPVKEESKPDAPQSDNPFHVKNIIDKCLFCGRCEHNCPAQAISIDRKNRTWTIDREKCMVCGVCAEGCPAHSLSMEEDWQEGEDRALVLTLQGKAPVRRGIAKKN